MSTNKELPWDEFSTESYYKQYTGGSILPEDRVLGRFVVGAQVELGVPFRSCQTGIDICNGGVVRVPALIAPFIADDGQLEWADYGKPQVEHAKHIIDQGSQGNLGPWADHQTHMGNCHSAWSGAAIRACRLGRAVNQDIFTLPPDTYDIAIMGFGACSLTGSKEEWRKAMSTFLRCVKAGGMVTILYMVGSTGYDSAGQAYPAVSLTPEEVMDVCDPELTQMSQAYVPASHGARESEEKFTYKGMGALVGLRK